MPHSESEVYYGKSSTIGRFPQVFHGNQKSAARLTELLQIRDSALTTETVKWSPIR